MSNEIPFYDLASTEGPRTWSVNPLKTRIYLNYKKLPYKTTFVRIQDVQTKMKELGFPPHQDGGKEYSVPGVVLNGQKIMDSVKIAHAIEKVHPTPAVHLDSPVVQTVYDNLNKLVTALTGVFGPSIMLTHFDEEGREFFFRERLSAAGIKSMDDFPKDTEKLWEAAREPLEALVKLLKENPEGPFFLGKEFSYADVYWAAGLHFMDRCDQATFKRVVSQDKVFADFYAACKPYYERED